jgi:hypothetical protein
VTAPHAPAREPQTFAGPSRLARYASLVKLPHTVFALPFALVGVVLASYAHAVTLRQVGWVVLAFTAARFAAMAFNRVADRDVDAANPRTRSREIPSGLLGVREAQALVFAAALVFVGAAWALNPLCGWLSPAALPGCSATAKRSGSPGGATWCWASGSASRRWRVPGGGGPLERAVVDAVRPVARGGRPGWPGSTSSTRCRTSSSTARTGCARCRRR